MGSPVEFIQFHQENGQFSVNPAAAAVLRRCQGPLAVVAVCGRARQGKSFLLNQLIRKFKGSTHGFTVSPTHRPCTKGLWLWSEPIPLPSVGPDGQRQHLLLVDCEGIDAYDQMTPRDYLEEALAAQPNTNQDVQARNQVRASIKALFPDRDCFPLVRPATDESMLAKMDSLPLESLRPEFRKGLDTLVQLISTKCRPKQFRGGVTTGPALAGLAEAFVAAINQGAVPVIASAWQSVVMAECQRSLDAALRVYAAQFGDGTGLSPEEGTLRAHHGTALVAAVHAFNASALGATEERQPFEQRLRDMAQERFDQLCRQKFSEADATVSAMLMHATTQFHQAMAADGVLAESKLTALFGEVRQFLVMYEGKAAGPSKAQRLAAWLQDVLLEGLRQLLSKSLAGIAAAEGRAAAVAADLQTARQEVVQLRGQLETGRAREERLRDEVQTLTSTLAAETSKLQRELSEARADGLLRTTALSSELATAQQNLAATRSNLEAAQQGLAAAQKRQQEEAAALATAQASIARLEQQLADVRAREADSSRIASSTQDEVNRLQRQLDQARSSDARNSQEAARGQEQCAKLKVELADARVLFSDLQTSAVATREELAQARARESAAQQALEALRSEQQRLQASGQAAQQDVMALRQQLQDAQQRGSNTEERLASVQRQAEQLAAEVQARNAEVQQMRQETAQKLEEAARTASTQAEQASIWGRQVASLQRQLDESHSSDARNIQEAARERENCARLKAEVADARVALSDLQNSAATTREELAQARAREADALQALEALRAEQMSLHAVGQRSLAVVQQDVAALRQQLQDTLQHDRQTGEQLASVQRQAEQLAAEVQARNAEVQQVRQEAAQKLEEAARASSTHAAQAAALGHQELLQREEELRQVRQQLADEQQSRRAADAGLTAAGNDLHQQLAAGREQVARLEQEVGMLRQQLASAATPSAPPMFAATPSATPMFSAPPMFSSAPMQDVTQPAAQRKNVTVARKRGVGDAMDEDDQQPARKKQMTASNGTAGTPGGALTPAVPTGTPGGAAASTPPPLAGTTGGMQSLTPADRQLNPDKMSVKDIKSWLTEKGCEGDVFTLGASARKDKFVALMKQRLGQE